MKTLDEMTAEIREVNQAKGWRETINPWGDYVALLVSEISEALEAYRSWKLADATEAKDMSKHPLGVLPKPEGVGSEFADILIRYLDMCDVHGCTLLTHGLVLDEVPWNEEPKHMPSSFASHLAYMTYLASITLRFPPGGGSPEFLHGELDRFLSALVGTAARWGIDLNTEYERKIAYNRTRPWHHGGKTL